MMMNLNFPNCIKVAELDCSSGQNAFLAISEIINTISVLCQQSNQNPPEIDCCLNDLPENDFNATFKSIPFFNKELMITNQASLHLIHSSYALHWLSKVPEKLVNDKENVYITNASSQSAYKAYLNQFNRDFTMFLKLIYLEDVWDDLPVSRLKYNALDDFQEDFQEVFQTTSRRSSGLLGTSMTHAFNMPFYDPNEQELKEVIQNEGSFEINDLETHEYDLGHSNCDNQEDDEAGYNEANCIRAVTESMLVVHFGEDIIDILFDKYARHVTQHASRRNKTSVTLVVALTKK
ncbi:hypothetical protein YC2023_062671 [Brassica napus]|nr:unnamed protein product [Brassica oleracea]